jgi:type VI secretion system secreted protein Hcp
MKACATGEHIKEATITQRKAGKGQQEFLIIKMSDLIITGVAPSGSGADGSLAESVLFQCAKVDLEYKPQKADGSLEAGIHFKYDIKGNKEG